MKKKLVIPIICSTCSNKDKKIFKEKELTVILKSLGLINNIELYQKII